ncbi:MAG: WbqC family protein [Bacteroidales bacterium]|nr:WbqC family protein [Bacteroidales bacterium]
MKSSQNRVILSTAYLPPVEYLSAIYNSAGTLIEQCERFQKQSYRSRCHIYSASGLLALTIPVSRADGHYLPIREMRIDYSGKWQQEHWRAIVSAYRTSPFFEYYEEDFAPFYHKRYEFLFDFNSELLVMILNLMGVKCNVDFTQEFIHEYDANETLDLRERIHPKRNPFTHHSKKESGQYFQVFAHKLGFIPNLSSADLLFNEGPDSISYL